MSETLPNVVVTNLHRRFTGISATVLALLPEQRKKVDIAFVDWGELGLPGTLSIRRLWIEGFKKPLNGRYRVLHARRGIDMALGILLRATPGQRWRLIFTSSANKLPGKRLASLIKSMDVVLATSIASAAFLPWHSRILPHGIDTDYFQPSNDRAKRRIIGYAGRIRHSKGADLFVRSMIRLLPQFPNYTAELVGLCKPPHTEFENQLKSEIVASNLEDRIRFLGHADRCEMLAFYQKCAICVTPSRIEGYGLVPFEAMACGTPVVASDASSVWPTAISTDVGAIVQSGNLVGFVDAIGNQLNRPDLHTTMRQSARDKVATEFTIDNEVHELVSIYEQLIQGQDMPRYRMRATNI